MEKINNKNRGYLKLLSVFHYVVGGLVAAFSLVFLIHTSIGLYLILAPPNELPQSDANLPPDMFGWMFFITGLIILLIGLTLSVCLINSGRFLAKRKRYWFSFVTACIECFITPFGTILGIFTIIVLSKDSVRDLYGLDRQ